jgi:hypothetical protein
MNGKPHPKTTINNKNPNPTLVHLIDIINTLVPNYGLYGIPRRAMRFGRNIWSCNYTTIAQYLATFIKFAV